MNIFSAIDKYVKFLTNDRTVVRYPQSWNQEPNCMGNLITPVTADMGEFRSSLVHDEPEFVT